MSDLISAAPPQLPTNRKFGGTGAAVFAALAAYAYWNDRGLMVIAASIAAILFAGVTLLAPQALTRLNRHWYGLGILLGKITGPVVLGLIFFVLITPVALALRLFGRDDLKIKKRSVESYWIDRSPPGPPSDSFKNQY
ncbi:MAG: SxtJ family membrane protein [Gammaproteobacteria bacterium]